MPNYNANPINAIYPGDTITLVNAEQPAVGQASQQVAIAPVYGVDDVGVTVKFRYAVAHSAIQYDIQTADVDADANYFTIYSTTNVNGENVNLSVQRSKFLRVKRVSAGENNVNETVTATR